MHETLSLWCADRIAEARNQLQIIANGHRYVVEGLDVTDRLKAQAEDDVSNLTAIVAALSEASDEFDRTKPD